MDNLTFEAVFNQLSERGRLEWEMAVLRAENLILKAQQQPDPDDGTLESE